MLLSSNLQPNLVIKELKETNLIRTLCFHATAYHNIASTRQQVGRIYYIYYTYITRIHYIYCYIYLHGAHQKLDYLGHKIFSNSLLINKNDVCTLHIHTVNLCMSNFVTEHIFSGCG